MTIQRRAWMQAHPGEADRRRERRSLVLQTVALLVLIGLLVWGMPILGLIAAAPR
jgi:hypothetical protein